MPFFIIFLMIPLIEISVFIAVGEEIGIVTTLMLAFLTAIIGGGLVRYQGIQTLMAARETLGSRRLPAQEIFDGFCLVAAGALLITPGFVTDIIGFSLLIPRLRIHLKDLLSRYFTVSGSASYDASRDDGVIEAEYHTIDDDKLR